MSTNKTKTVNSILLIVLLLMVATVVCVNLQGQVTDIHVSGVDLRCAQVGSVLTCEPRIIIPDPPDPPPTQGSLLTTVYGAKCDGVTNDQPAIQKAFDNANSWTNKTLLFPQGKVCVVARGVRIQAKNGWTIEGMQSTIKAANGMCLDGCGPLWTLHTVDGFKVNNLT